jgi:hypothetical protein
MKRVWMYVIGLSLMGIFCAGGRVFADGDVWSAATSAATTASTNAVALMIVLIGIPVALFGYKIVKICLSRG